MPLYDENGNQIGEMPATQTRMIQPIQQNQPNFLQGIFGGILNPVDRLVKGAMTVGTQAGILGNRVLGGKEGGEQARQFARNAYGTENFLSRDEQEQYKNPLNVAKDFASVIALGAGGPITGGLLGGFGSTYGQDDLQSTVMGTGIGGLTGGAFKVGGKAFQGLGNKLTNPANQSGNGMLAKIGKGIVNKADDQEAGSFVRRIGGPRINKKFGGMQQFSDWKRLGFNTAKDSDELVDLAKMTIQERGGQLKGAINQLDQSGVTITKQEALSTLQKQLKNSKLGSDKRVTQTVINDIETAFGNRDALTPTEFYELKIRLGEKGNFKFGLSPKEETAQGLYQSAYKRANDLFEKKLTDNGLGDFRALNKDISSSIRALGYAEDAGSRQMASRPFNLLDLVTAGGAAAAGGPVGMAAGAIGSKVLQSPMAEGLIVKSMRGAGNMLQGLGASGAENAAPRFAGLGNLATKTGNLLSNPRLTVPAISAFQGIGNMSPALAADGDLSTIDMAQSPDGAYMADQGQDQEIIDARNQIAAQLYQQVDAKGKPLYDATEAIKQADAILMMQYGVAVPVAAKAKALTEGEKKYSAAGQQAQAALQLLESGQVSTGLLPSIGNKISGFFDAQSPVQTDYLSKLAAARGSAVSALSGANVPESEYARIAALIPEDNDEPKKAAQKLRSFIEAMKVYSSQ